MAINKDKKKVILSKVEGALSEAQSVVFVNFHGLTVAGITEMRRALRAAGVQYYVAKKNLIRRALNGAGLTGDMPELPGEIAIAWSDDLIAPAREVYVFQKKTPDNIKIVGGIFEKAFMNQAMMMEMASIPALPVLHGKFVNIINSPIQRFVIGLSAIAGKKSE